MERIDPIPLPPACKTGHDNAMDLTRDLRAIFGKNAPHFSRVYRWWTGKSKVGPSYVPMVLEYARGKGIALIEGAQSE